jgi:hypothetical protein
MQVAESVFPALLPELWAAWLSPFPFFVQLL